MDEISRLSTACTITNELLNEMEQKINLLCLEGVALNDALIQVFGVYLEGLMEKEIDLLSFDRLPKE